MIEFEWNFGILVPYWGNFLRGAIVTIELSVIVILASLLGGIVIGMARYSSNKWLNLPATIYVEIFRNTPVFVQIVWFFYAFPVLIGVQMEGFVAAILGVGLNMTAYTSEIYRAGIQSIHKGQWEAAKAVGMPYMRTMRRIILPQAVRRMIPAFANRIIEGAKATALASAIAVGELLHEGELLAQALYRPLEIYTVIAVLFFVLIYPLALWSYWLERRLRTDEKVTL